MKKLLAILLSVIMLFAFVACGDKAKENEKETDKSSVEESVVAENSDTASNTPDADSEYIVMPDVMSMTPEEAEQTLKDAGFTVKVREKNSDDVPAGQIAEVDLTVGQSYERGTKCFVIVSSGPTAGAQALIYKQSALVESRTELSQGENSAYQPINYEYMKAVWLSQYDMENVYKNGTTQRSKEEFTERVKTLFGGLKALGFNTLFVQLRPNGDSFYPSAYYCPSKYVVGMYGADFTYDPLEIMVEEAHALELSIHGWINPLRCMNPTSVELVNISYGLRKFTEEHMDDYVIKCDNMLYLNPGYEEVRQLIIDGAAEIVRYYDVDGIHMDDYFYPNNMGFEYDRAAFQAQTEFSDQAFFRRHSVNLLVSGLYSAVKAENPNVMFGISPAGSLSYTRSLFADVDTWLAGEGYVDYIMPQLYQGMDYGNSSFDKRYAQWHSLIKNDKIRLIPGMDLSPAAEGSTSEWVNNKDVLKTCIDYAIGYGHCSGFSLFSGGNILSAVNGERVPSTKEEIDNLMSFVAEYVDTRLN